MPGDRVNPFNNTPFSSELINQLLGQAVQTLSQQAGTDSPAAAAAQGIANQTSEEVLHAAAETLSPEYIQAPLALDALEAAAPSSATTIAYLSSPEATLNDFNDLPSPPDMTFPYSIPPVPLGSLNLPWTDSDDPGESGLNRREIITDPSEINPFVFPPKQSQSHHTRAAKTSEASIELKPAHAGSQAPQAQTSAEPQQAGPSGSRQTVIPNSAEQNQPNTMSPPPRALATRQTENQNASAEAATNHITLQRLIPPGRPLQRPPVLPRIAPGQIVERQPPTQNTAIESRRSSQIDQEASSDRLE